MEILGWIGTALVIIAYYPQIHHLWVEKCAWGISVWTWGIWLFASILLLIYCIMRGEVLLSVVQLSNMSAIVLTIALVRRSSNVCTYHSSVDENGAKRQQQQSSLRRSEDIKD
jgi:uncharacterized protein with PQ loop repeat